MNHLVHFKLLLLLKGVHIKSSLLFCGLLLVGFKLWKQQRLLYFHQNQLGLSQIPFRAAVALYFTKLLLNEIRFLSVVQSIARCTITGTARCVFKIFNLSRLSIHSAAASFLMWSLTKQATTPCAQGVVVAAVLYSNSQAKCWSIVCSIQIIWLVGVRRSL
jgi:hypothetical protein